ncbi:MAG: hypothetical protein ACK5NB_07980 [Flavobacteriaceae bacterium]
MELYNWNAIIEASNLYDTATEKRSHFIESIKMAKQYFEDNKNKDIEYLVNDDFKITINGKTILFKNVNKSNRPKTHGEYYKNILAEFIEKIEEQINVLYWYVLDEEQINDCLQKPTIKDKYLCLSALKIQYTKHLNDINGVLQPPNNDTYFKMNAEYSTAIEKINNELSKLKENKTTANRPTTPKQVYTLRPNFDNFDLQIQIIHDNTKDLFNATLDDWKNLFSNDIKQFKKPIELKHKTTLADLQYFLSELNRVELFKISNFGIIIENTKAFFNRNGVITSKKLSDGKNKATSGVKHSYIIKNLLNKLKLD